MHVHDINVIFLNLPMHTNPVPVYPGSHSQKNEPSVLAHCALV